MRARAERLIRVAATLLALAGGSGGRLAAQDAGTPLAVASPGTAIEGDLVRRALAERVRMASPEDVLGYIDRLGATERERFDVRLVRGALALDLGRVAEATRDLPDVTGSPDWAAAFVAPLRARALLRSGDAAAALRILDDLPRTALHRALRVEAQTLLDPTADVAREVRDLTRANPPEVDTFALRVLDAMSRRARHEDGTSALRALLVERPHHPDAPAMEAELARWLDSPSVQWTVEERVLRAQAFVSHHRARDAVREVAAIPARSVDARVTLARADALFAARDFDAAAESYDRVDTPRARFLAARARLRGGHIDAALDALRRFVRDDPRHASANEAEWLVGATLLREGREREAERALQRFVRGPRGRRSPRLRREAEWHLALLAFDAGRSSEAAAAFAAWGSAAEAPIDRARARYWHGRAMLAAGDRAAATTAFREALHLDPLGWYALHAASRLRALGGDPGPPLPDDAPTEHPVVRPTIPDPVRFFASLGFDDEAVVRLRELEATDRGARGLVEALAEMGDANRGYRRLGAHRLLASAPSREAEWVWRAAYPRPYASRVDTAAAAAGLRAEAVYAVMRQESAFDPRVVSYADAIGLMQLLPATAAEVARERGEPFSRDELYRPDRNITLGAHYLGTLVHHVGLPLAFAAYNAGEHRVHEWLARARRDGGPSGLELDRFVENIPFDQTRNYIRRVTASLAHYLYALDPSAGWPDLALPDRVGGER